MKVEGGGRFGLGHVVRSLELAAVLRRSGVSIAGFACNDDAASRARIRAAGYPCDVLPISQRGSLVQMVDRTSANAIVVDQPTDAVRAFRALRRVRPGLFLAALDPPVPDVAAFDAVITLFHHGTAPRPARTTGYHEGVEFAVLGSQFSMRRAPPNGLIKEVKEILVCFGGTDPQRLTVKVLRALQRGLPGTPTLHIVLGPGLTFGSVVRQAARDGALPYELHTDVHLMSRLMAGCQLAICSGGATLMELCCVGCPALVIAQNEAEARFATYVSRRGAARYVGPARRVTEREIRAAVLAMCAAPAVRRRQAAHGQRLIDGRGTRRTASILLKELEWSLQTHST